MLKVLIKKQLYEIFRGYFTNAKTGKARSKANTTVMFLLFAVVMVALLGGMFGALAVFLCGTLCKAGLDWLYFLLFSLLGAALGVFGSVFNTYSGLYLAKDNDLLLSMPIPVKTVMTARLAGVYLMGLMYSATVLVPAIGVYIFFFGVTVARAVGMLGLIVVVSLTDMFLSCLLGWGVAKISLRLKNKSFVTVAASITFIVLYYLVYFRAMNWLQDLVSNAEMYGEKIRTGARVLWKIGSIGAGDMAALAICLTVLVAALTVVWRLMAHSFMKIATASATTEKRKKTGAKQFKQHTVPQALLIKELGRFTASANYMLNCGLSLLLLPAFGIFLLVKGEYVLGVVVQVFGERSGSTCVLLTAVLCMLNSMADMAAPAVSLEGKSYWLLRSLPVSTWEILTAKLSLQLLLGGVPAVFCGICGAIVLPGTVVEKLFVVLIPLGCVALFACVDLAVGLKNANLNWTNELYPIKQNVSIAIALFGCWLYAIAVGGAYMWVGWNIGPVWYLLAVLALSAAGTAVLYRWLMNRGTVCYEKL